MNKEDAFLTLDEAAELLTTKDEWGHEGVFIDLKECTVYKVCESGVKFFELYDRMNKLYFRNEWENQYDDVFDFIYNNIGKRVDRFTVANTQKGSVKVHNDDITYRLWNKLVPKGVRVVKCH
jgi:hypothetical protein